MAASIWSISSTPEIRLDDKAIQYRFALGYRSVNANILAAKTGPGDSSQPTPSQRVACESVPVSHEIALRTLDLTAILTKRCLIPADGFYEWRKMGR